MNLKQPAKPRKIFNKILIGLGITVAILGAGLAFVLSSAVIPIPQPTGPHAVGFTSSTLTDSSRSMKVQGKDSPRVITLDIWYPAKTTEGFKATPYSENALNKMLEKYQGIPASLNSEKPSFSFEGATPLEGSHPVVIFNHGYGSFSKQNFSTMQQLASFGYVVISLAHPGDSLIARDAAGNTLEFDGQDRVFQNIQQSSKAAAPTLSARLEGQRQSTTPAEFAKASQELAKTLPYSLLEPIKKRWLEDTLFVIQSLSGTDKPKALEGANSQNITVMGHSLGGTIALEVGKNPPAGVQRIINLDGPWLDYSSGETAPLRVPMLALLSTQNLLEGKDLGLHGTFDALLKGSSSGSHVLEIVGTAHFNFTDLNFIPILKRFSPILGDVDNKRMGTLLNTVILEFLKREPSSADFSKPLLPEVGDIQQTFFPVVQK
jgi:pimeloyl-ACP methyl ester carboxylesterase